MHLVYIDDSRDEKICVYSALTVPVVEWSKAFAQVRDFRKSLKQSHGIYVYKEFHATEFVAGRGHIADRIVTKTQRAGIFTDALRMVSQLPGVRLFNAICNKEEDERVFERLLTRLNRAMQVWGSHALLVCDEGKELAYTRLARRLRVYNPIRSQYGVWGDTGQSSKNLPLDRIVEDSFFKDSAQSYFIQLVDFCAYSLLRQERPLASKTRYGLDKAFNELDPILQREATRKDPRGIIRL